MPYIIETTQSAVGAPGDAEGGRFLVSRRAVATLEEAREAVRGVPSVPVRAHRLLTEQGGTVGPLPDGTVIEVEGVDYDRLLYDGEMGSIGSMPTEGTDAEIIAAYNAAQEKGE